MDVNTSTAVACQCRYIGTYAFSCVWKKYTNIYHSFPWKSIKTLQILKIYVENFPKIFLQCNHCLNCHATAKKSLTLHIADVYLYGAASCRNTYWACWSAFSCSDCMTTRDFLCPGSMSWPSANSTFSVPHLALITLLSELKCNQIKHQWWWWKVE